jgi:hypothetical protein
MYLDAMFLLRGSQPIRNFDARTVNNPWIRRYTEQPQEP